MIFVYRPQGSKSARALVDVLDGMRARDEGRLLRRLKASDKVVMWGAYIHGLPSTVKALNNVPLLSKFDDAVKLKAGGIRTVEVSRVRPMIAGQAPVDPLLSAWDAAQTIAEDFAGTSPSRNQIAIQGLRELITSIQTCISLATIAAPVASPSIPDPSWIARSSNHVGGNDLLSRLQNGDYYAKKEAFVAEYRVHSFMGRSIRAGRKVPRTVTDPTPFTGTANPWIRSWDGGWRISYADDFAASSKKQKIRDIAHAATKALGLHFGAVDVGELADGTLVVLEVNRAPGIEEGTIEAYGRAVHKWLSGEWATFQMSESREAVTN